MLNIKTLIAAALLSSVAAVSFAQTPTAPKNAGATAPAASAATTKHVVKKHVAKKHAAKKAKATVAAAK